MPNIKKENYNYEIDGVILMPTLELANIDNVSYNHMLKKYIHVCKLLWSLHYMVILVYLMFYWY